MRNLNRCLTLAVELFAAALLLASFGSALADVHYVDVNCTNATTPYTNWATAATNIQDAVDAAVAGDEIVVTNGIYATGGRNYNRVTVDKPLSVRSVNGPQSTIIYGGGSRCAYLTDSATLSGFTLTGGFVRGNGGGISCLPTAVVSNCVISGNESVGNAFRDIHVFGGGAYGGTLNNCTLSANRAGTDCCQDLHFYEGVGGGAAFCTLNNCTLTDNWADRGAAGAVGCTLNNCRLSGNGASSCTLNNCTLTGNS